MITDIAGEWIVSDTTTEPHGGRLLLAWLGTAGADPFLDPQFIASPNCSWEKESHIHPFLSPDGSKAFFNSDESGILQAYMVRGLDV